MLPTKKAHWSLSALNFNGAQSHRHDQLLTWLTFVYSPSPAKAMPHCLRPSTANHSASIDYLHSPRPSGEQRHSDKADVPKAWRLLPRSDSIGQTSLWEKLILYCTLSKIISVPRVYFLAFSKYSISVSYSQVMPLLLLASVQENLKPDLSSVPTHFADLARFCVCL